MTMMDFLLLHNNLHLFYIIFIEWSCSGMLSPLLAAGVIEKLLRERAKYWDIEMLAYWRACHRPRFQPSFNCTHQNPLCWIVSPASKVTGYSVMTYQAIQVWSSQEDKFKNRHQNLELGIWNCCVYLSGDKKKTLVDSLLSKVAPDGTTSGSGNVRTFCLMVDLLEETLVEPSMTLFQGALVCHLIENPPLDDS